MEKFDMVSQDSQSYKIIITSNSVFDDYRLFDFKTSSDEILASLAWMGKSLSTSDTIFQPAIVTNNAVETIYLSYGGHANYIGDSEIIVMPRDGTLYSIAPPKPYYFNNSDPLSYEPRYSLMSNNQSIEMSNISIFNSDHSQGVKVQMQASCEGGPAGTPNGYIVILLSVTTIN